MQPKQRKEVMTTSTQQAGERTIGIIKPHWLVKFMRRGFEPPMPFGKTHMVVAAKSRKEAIAIVHQSGMVSPMYHERITATPTSLEVSYHFTFTSDPTYQP
jgi:hypothetical protein